MVRYALSVTCGFMLFMLFYIIMIPLEGFELAFLFKGKFIFVAVLEVLVFTGLIMLLHNLVIIQIDRNQTKLENARLKLKSAEAASILLKQQIHPHFLFNTLHTIKILYKEDAEIGEEYLVQLADFLRTAVSKTQETSATLKEELNLFVNYLNMQRMRFGDALKWEVNIEDPQYLNSYLPAFSLQPLAENAIKHNHFSAKQPLHLLVEQREGNLTVSNGINKKKYSDLSIGIGLVNLSERYELWSGYELEIKDNGETFAVHFKLSVQ
ncbi:sensor histidine kinase [Elizabethkingia anophelis]|uniref:sensor histidine kinase n=1 Tax=Elizabethkingia anophelis TaxID=1117645 RepID=UPI0038915599